MNWLRDNILKVVLFVFVAIIVVVVIVACTMGGGKTQNTTEGYIALENKLQNAAISYVKEHKSVLPKTTETIKKIKLDTLIEAGKINKLHAVEDGSVTCKGYVEIEKLYEDKNEYKYIPYLSCGKYYVTKTISDYIIDKETENGTFNRTVDDGLYASNDEYIFRGEHPDNFIILGEHLYRIIKINSEGQLQLISTTRTEGYYMWDDRYNITKDDFVGITDFGKSRLYDTLVFLYENELEEQGEIYFSDLEKTYITEHDFCIGKRDTNDTNIYSGVECTETMPLKVGLISLNEYARVSLDANCTGIYNLSCSNYNYFTSLDTKSQNTITTLTAVSNNTYDYFSVSYTEVYPRKAYIEAPLYPVIYINDKVIYKSGSGTYIDPYVIR